MLPDALRGVRRPPEAPTGSQEALRSSQRPPGAPRDSQRLRDASQRPAGPQGPGSKKLAVRRSKGAIIKKRLGRSRSEKREEYEDDDGCEDDEGDRNDEGEKQDEATRKHDNPVEFNLILYV